MTVGKILEQFDAVKNNEISDSVKLGWLSEVEGKVLCEIKNLSPDSVAFPNSSCDELSIPESFSRVYLLYLGAMTELAAGNYDAYSHLYKEFEAEMSSYAKFCIRNRNK